MLLRSGELTEKSPRAPNLIPSLPVAHLPHTPTSSRPARLPPPPPSERDAAAPPPSGHDAAAPPPSGHDATAPPLSGCAAGPASSGRADAPTPPARGRRAHLLLACRRPWVTTRLPPLPAPTPPPNTFPSRASQRRPPPPTASIATDLPLHRCCDLALAALVRLAIEVQAMHVSLSFSGHRRRSTVLLRFPANTPGPSCCSLILAHVSRGRYSPLRAIAAGRLIQDASHAHGGGAVSSELIHPRARRIHDCVLPHVHFPIHFLL
ncbi:myosin-I heavy chain-like [Triticum aestivum]|uniref:myosin-I heavy chain-like n=1 Tax=Triticum aestivum TaxID=4565 RepID=UPI001D027FE3|nr:myosin-I heavy chain-like [Triticum aestivum]